MLRALIALGLCSLALTAVPSYAAAPARAAAAPQVVGRGTPASCTAAAFRKAVAKGGTVTFDCGPDPVTIVMDRQAEVHNTSRKVVIDGGGLVTLSGGGRTRLLYPDTRDPRPTRTNSPRPDPATPQLGRRD